VYHESATFDTKKQATFWGLSLEKKLQRDGVTSTISQMTTVDNVLTLHESTLNQVNREMRGFDASLKALHSASFASRPISAVKTHDIVQWAISHAETRAPATVLHTLMTLRSAYTTARAVHGVPTDVLVVGDAVTQLMKLGIAATSREVHRRVSDDEIDKAVTAYEKSSGIAFPLRLIANLAVAFPRRRGELLTMRWEHYDGKQIKLLDTKSPTGKRDEIVPIPPLAKALLDTLPQKESGVILPYAPASVGSAFIHAVQKAELPPARFHDLRHEGISRLFEMGLGIPSVSLISGHKNWSTLKRYTNLQPKNVLEEINASSKRAQEASAKSEGT